MAFIPDDALDKYDEIPPAARDGYSYFCRYRNHRTGIAPKNFDACAVKHRWSRATKFLVQKILTEKGWIEIVESGVRPLIGDFSPVDKSNFLDSQQKNEIEKSKNLDSNQGNEKNKSKNLDSDAEKSKNLDSKVQNRSKNLDFLPDSAAESLKNWTEKSKKLDSHIRKYQPLNQQEETKETREVLESERSHAHATEMSAEHYPPMELTHLEAFNIFFADYKPTSFQKQLIKNRIRDGTIWRQVLTFWAGNNYKPGSIEKMCDKYDEILKESQQQMQEKSDGTIQPNQSKFRSSGEKREQRAVDEHLAIERVREANRARRALRGGNAGSRE